MTFDFTERQYVAAIRKVIEVRGPEYRGADPMNPGLTCSYLPAELAPEIKNGSKYMIEDVIDVVTSQRASNDRCVHGQALHDLGVDDELLAAHEKNTVSWLLRQESAFSPDFIDKMQSFQARQDEGDQYVDLSDMLDRLQL